MIRLMLLLLLPLVAMAEGFQFEQGTHSVSYTHLTLPTICSV